MSAIQSVVAISNPLIRHEKDGLDILDPHFRIPIRPSVCVVLRDKDLQNVFFHVIQGF